MEFHAKRTSETEAIDLERRLPRRIDERYLCVESIRSFILANQLAGVQQGSR